MPRRSVYLTVVAGAVSEAPKRYPESRERQEITTLSLPRHANAQVSRAKVLGYLLSESHPVGAAKARYFRSRGYSVERPEELERSLLQIAETGRVRSKERSHWGTKYVVVGEVVAPDGNLLSLATVWMVKGDGAPVLITAYPDRSQSP